MSMKVGADLGSKLMKMLNLSSQPDFNLNKGVGVVVDVRDLLGYWNNVNIDVVNVTGVGYYWYTNTTKRTWRIRVYRFQMNSGGTWTFSLVRIKSPEGTMVSIYDSSAVTTYRSDVLNQDVVIPPGWAIGIYVGAWTVASYWGLEMYRYEELTERG